MKKSRNSTLAVVVIALVVYFIYCSFGQSGSCAGASSTGRIRLDSSMCVMLDDWYEGNDSYFDDTVIEAMQSFYEQTGVQPFVLLISDDNSAGDELDDIAQDYYKNKLFADTDEYDEGHFVVVIKESDGSYNTGSYVGEDAASYIPDEAKKAVLDDEAVGEFLMLLSENLSQYTVPEAIANTFKNGASEIMGQSRVTTYIILAIAVICILYTVFNVLKKRKESGSSYTDGHTYVTVEKQPDDHKGAQE